MSSRGEAIACCEWTVWVEATRSEDALVTQDDQTCSDNPCSKSQDQLLIPFLSIHLFP